MGVRRGLGLCQGVSSPPQPGVSSPPLPPLSRRIVRPMRPVLIPACCLQAQSIGRGEGSNPSPPRGPPSWGSNLFGIFDASIAGVPHSYPFSHPISFLSPIPPLPSLHAPPLPPRLTSPPSRPTSPVRNVVLPAAAVAVVAAVVAAVAVGYR